MTGFGSHSSATSSTRGASSHQRGWGTSGSSGWGDTKAGGSGWGSGANNDASASDGWSNGPPAWGEQASASGDTQTEGWGPSGWGTTGTDLGPGWGKDSIPNHNNETPSAATVATIPGSASPDIPMGGTWTDGNAGFRTTTSSSRAMPSVSSPSEPDATHGEPNGDNAAPAAVDRSPLECKAPSDTSLLRSSANKSIKVRPRRSDADIYIGSKSSGDSKMRSVNLSCGA
jgi:hypothetical protein